MSARGSLVGVLAVFSVLAVFVVACATAPGPGEPGYPYNLQGTYGGNLTVAGAEYEAVIRMETGSDGTVSGGFAAAPLDAAAGDRTGSIEGDFSGSIIGDSLVWRSSWVVPSSGCSGVLRGRGPVARGGAEVEGEVRMAGSCVESAAGSFRLSR